MIGVRGQHEHKYTSFLIPSLIIGLGYKNQNDTFKSWIIINIYKWLKRIFIKYGQSWVEWIREQVTCWHIWNIL